MREILEKTLDYLKLKVPDFQVASFGPKTKRFTCPYCGQESAQIQPFNSVCSCSNCPRPIIGDLFDFVRYLEPDKFNFTNVEIIKYISKLFNVPIELEEDIDEVFAFYKANKFDMCPVRKGLKAPTEIDWPNKIHTDVYEWKKWVEDGLNVGVKTGKCSDLTILDIDSKNVTPKLAELLISYEGFFLDTPKGFNYCFKYESDLPATAFELDGAHIDIKNDGGQVVMYPSKVDEWNGKKKKIAQMSTIPKMSDELRTFIKEKSGKTKLSTTSSVIIDPSFNGNFLGQVSEGNRNNFLTSFGGILRKNLNMPDTARVLEMINKKFISPPVSNREFQTIVGSINKYVTGENLDLAERILSYFKIVREAYGRDIQEVMSEKKELVDKCMANLVKEGYLVKVRNLYKLVQKANWKTNFTDHIDEVNFKVPFFNDIAIFSPADMILMAAQTKIGKTTISLTIIKELINQGITPYYLSLEPGSRFKKTWVKMGGGDGDFKWDFVSDPTTIEFEPGAVTVIDWLMVMDKAVTDSVFKYLAEQLFKTQGFMFVFMQLKENGDYFAPNMVKMFPALSARYFYTDENDGTYGKWKVDAIREPRERIKTYEIDCFYDWDNHMLKKMEDKN